MQTFLPYKNFSDTAKCLDSKRLGKQRVEAYQILNVLEGKSASNAWKNHPAVLMWNGYTSALKEYMTACIVEWINRGYKNTMKFCLDIGNTEYPKWLGDENFHASHRSNLLRKNLEFYSKYNWSEPNNLPYVWPVVKKSIIN